MSVESNVVFALVFLFSLSDWIKKLAPLSQPIRCKTKVNRDFPRLTLITCICLNFVLVHFVFFSCCDWLE